VVGSSKEPITNAFKKQVLFFVRRITSQIWLLLPGKTTASNFGFVQEKTPVPMDER
jgi:hypothetical protein